MLSDLVCKLTRLVTMTVVATAHHIYLTALSSAHISLRHRLKNVCIAFQLALFRTQGSSEAEDTSMQFTHKGYPQSPFQCSDVAERSTA